MQWILAASLLLGGSGCTDQVQPGRDPLPYEALPSNTLFGTEITFHDSLALKARVRAGRVQWYPSQQQTLLDSGVYVEFYSPRGARAARLWCDSAVWTMHRATCGHSAVFAWSPIVLVLG